jgi:hypothetical protein
MYVIIYGHRRATRFTHEFLFSESSPPKHPPAAAPGNPGAPQGGAANAQSATQSNNRGQTGSASQGSSALWVWDAALLDDDTVASSPFVDLYQPFWDHAEKVMRERLPMSAYPIPEGFVEKIAMSGKGNREQLYSTNSYAYQTDKLRQIRTCLVKGGSQLQVCICFFAHMHTYMRQIRTCLARGGLRAAGIQARLL